MLKVYEIDLVYVIDKITYRRRDYHSIEIKRNDIDHRIVRCSNAYLVTSTHKMGVCSERILAGTTKLFLH